MWHISLGDLQRSKLEGTHHFMASSEDPRKGEVVDVLDRSHRLATNGDVREWRTGEGLAAVPVHR